MQVSGLYVLLGCDEWLLTAKRSMDDARLAVETGVDGVDVVIVSHSTNFNLTQR
jgi:hypothetical protein